MYHKNVNAINSVFLPIVVHALNVQEAHLNQIICVGLVQVFVCSVLALLHVINAKMVISLIQVFVLVFLLLIDAL